MGEDSAYLLESFKDIHFLIQPDIEERLEPYVENTELLIGDSEEE